MPLAEVTFLDGLWYMLVFFGWAMALTLVVFTLIDNFRRDHSGWAKAAWTLLVVVFPLLGAICYQIARPRTVSIAPETYGGAQWAPGPTSARDEMTRIRMGIR